LHDFLQFPASVGNEVSELWFSVPEIEKIFCVFVEDNITLLKTPDVDVYSDMFQPQRQVLDNAGIKPLPKLDESLTIKKPDSSAGRSARAAYDPIELPSSFPSTLFKVSLFGT